MSIIKFSPNHIKALFLSIVLFFMFSLVSIVPAQANGLWEMQSGMNDQVAPVYGGNSTDVRVVLAMIIKAFLSLLAIVFLVLIILAGYKWMMAGGNNDKIEEARNQIMNAVIGLLIILAAYGITVFVFNRIGGAVNSTVY